MLPIIREPGTELSKECYWTANTPPVMLLKPKKHEETPPYLAAKLRTEVRVIPGVAEIVADLPRTGRTGGEPPWEYVGTSRRYDSANVAIHTLSPFSLLYGDGGSQLIRNPSITALPP